MLIPELRECIEKWDNLEDDMKGHYIGYVIGRFGVDMLAWGGSMWAIKLFRDVHKANTVLMLEKLAKSGANCEELVLASERYFVAREEYKAKCFISMKDQEKHIKGENNFRTKTNPSELIIPVEELVDLTKPLLGNGIPWRRTFGESAYIEAVDYKKAIGIFVSEDGSKRIPTSIGAIHYNSKGGYHVVPISPTGDKAIKVKGKSGS